MIENFLFPSDQPECQHRLCEYCNECHIEGCFLYAKQCLALFLLAFIGKRLQESTSDNEREICKVLKEAIESDDVLIEDLLAFARLQFRLFSNKPESQLYLDFYNQEKEYEKVVLKFK